MRTYTDCFICFMNLALNIARRTGDDEQREKLILEKVAGLLPTFSLDARPPEMAYIVNNVVKEVTGVEDPFEEDKRESNRIALRIAPEVRSLIRAASDPLLSAIEFSIAGNSIDLGANHDLDLDKTLREIVEDEVMRIKTEDPSRFRLEELRESLRNSSSLLYLADNAGEIVFDMLLIELIREEYPGIGITVAVRNSPIINDATMKDAEEIGLTSLVRVISSGSDTAGTLMEMCTPEFRDLFYSADTVIGKGQGNFETLSDIDRKVFLLFKTKCNAIARYTKSRIGDIMLITSGSDWAH
ncbi:MAG: damage-control phosphatase ARMT1 family protein [Sediminispirochaetaceae bacterium]